MKQDFLYGILCIIILIVLILTVFMGVALVIDGQKKNTVYQQYLYTERV